MRRKTSGAVLAVLALAFVVLVVPLPASASENCGTITSTSVYPHAKVIAIRGVGCRKARKVAKRFDHEGKEKSPWQCGLAHMDLPRLFSCGWGSGGSSLQSRAHALKAIGVN